MRRTDISRPQSLALRDAAAGIGVAAAIFFALVCERRFLPRDARTRLLLRSSRYWSSSTRPSRAPVRGSTRRISLSPVGNTRSAIRRARSRSGSRSPRSPSCACCSVSRRAHTTREVPQCRPLRCLVAPPVYVRRPAGRAKRPHDVELGDLPRMRRVLQAGVRLHHVLSSQPVRFWVREFGWDSNPPRPHAAPMDLAEDWLRAVAPGSGKSLGFSLTVPHDPHIGPWGN